MNDPVEVSVADCAYLAALVDHNASIYVDRRKQRNGSRSYVLVLEFSTIKPETGAWMRSKFPGSSGGQSTPRYVTSKACAVLVRAFSYLQSKTKLIQARLSFKLNEIKPSSGRQWTETEVELRAHLADQIAKAAKPSKPVRNVSLKAPKLEIGRVIGG